MYVIRPVRSTDLDQILGLANLTTFGLTTLPRDGELLAKRIRSSEQAFANIQSGEPQGQAYLLVLENLDERQVVGTCGIVSKVGGFEPFYAYRIEVSVHESIMLNTRKEIPVLHLVTEHNGPSEIGSLFLHPDYRQSGNGRLLSLSRFLMLAEFPKLFDGEVIAEMRGVIDEQGQSPFWDAVGKHFFDLDFPKADYLSMVNKAFIGDLMPNFPIYIPLLPASAQDVIGEVHENTRPARHFLECEGFRFNQMIDIFEAGPILQCPLKMIRAVRDSRVQTVSEVVEEIDDDQHWLVSNQSQDFRATSCKIVSGKHGVSLERSAAEALDISVGDTVRYVAPKAIDNS